MIGTEANYHAQFDRCTVRWLRQARVAAEWLQLANAGIHENGHMVVLEKNNLEVAAVISDWMNKTIR